MTSIPTLAGDDSATFDSRLLDAICARASFVPGEELRRKDNHYSDMYLIIDGQVDVLVEPDAAPIVVGPGAPIGEIGFLRGCRTTATAVARKATTALVIDDQALWRIEREVPSIAVVLLRALARTAEERLDLNQQLAPSLAEDDEFPVEILLCRNEQMLEVATRMRYRVYCEELGRSSPYADHDSKVIRDNLDDSGYTFLAMEDGRAIGTLRANLSTEGDLGVLEDLYGMASSSCHPDHTIICTKFIVEKSKRGSPASMGLIGAMASFALKEGIRECFIDCVPRLIPLYRRLGFVVSGEKFFHYENGPSVPLVLDVTKHGERLSRGVGR